MGDENPAISESLADSVSYESMTRNAGSVRKRGPGRSAAEGPQPDHAGGPPALPRGVAGAGQAVHTGPPEESCIAMRDDPVIEAVCEVRHRISEPSAGPLASERRARDLPRAHGYSARPRSTVALAEVVRYGCPACL